MRPLPTFPYALPVGVVPPTAQAQPPAQKKEKPKIKTPIPGTDWLRVITTEGNVFYTHRIEKRSVWTIPDEIKDAIAALEEQEKEEQANKARIEEEERKEVKRAKAEAREAAGKRKAEEVVALDEVVISKKARVDEEEEEGVDDEDEDEDEDEESEEEEEWQREAAAQLAAEAEAEKKRQEEEKKRREEEEARLKAEEEAAKNKPLTMPNRVDLSIEEAKALFKVGL